MENRNDPTLELLLKGITDPAQREALISAYSSLAAGGARIAPPGPSEFCSDVWSQSLSMSVL